MDSTDLSGEHLGRTAPPPFEMEHSACALIANVRKTGEASHGNVKRTLEALMKMGHRSGDINGEGDGCGLMTDIPRRLWTTYLEEAGRPGWLAEDRRFFVAHLMIPKAEEKRADELKAHILHLMREAGLDVLLERQGLTRPRILGRMARSQEPQFWQVAGLASQCSLDEVDPTLFELQLAIERETPVHVASLSAHSVVYKVQGSVETLHKYYPELRHPDYLSAITIGHSRYSTNTLSTFERVQPFTIIGHNGEFNTIARLRLEAQTIGVQLVPGGSDSQDLNRILETFIFRHGFSLLEALELLFPPILHEVSRLPRQFQLLHQAYRRLWGPLAQGPAAIVARYGDMAAFSVDALGLRPLWFGETEKEFFFSSERGVVPLEIMLRDPKPLAPGEKMAVQLERGRGVRVLDYHQVQHMLLQSAGKRFGTLKSQAPVQVSAKVRTRRWKPATLATDPERWLAVMGWSRDDVDFIRDLAGSGDDPVGSLGYDGPLAALAKDRQNLADYFKEAVAVVTNPSIDRERETEHFSTQAMIGPRPPLSGDGAFSSPVVEVDVPILLGGQPEPLLPPAQELAVAKETGTLRLEDVVTMLETAIITTAFREGEGIKEGLQRLAAEAVAAAQKGAQLILLDDGGCFQDENLWLDPHLAVAACDTALRQAEDEPNLRRRVGLVLRSGALRNLHDLIMALGLGADAVNPYLMLRVAVSQESGLQERVSQVLNLLTAVKKGLEKIISTMGIHELRGYGRLFASIGLSPEVAKALGTVNYCGSSHSGVTWGRLEADAWERKALLSGREQVRLTRTYRIYPFVWKKAAQVATGEAKCRAFAEHVRSLEREHPVCLRHLLDFRFPEPPPPISPHEVEAGLTGHDLPLVFSAMSFGSQGETAFRAYAEAAYRLNIICLNGEGGEIGDMIGRYPNHRGQQVASGRFGVNIELLNSTNLLEIKIGQGAKPGEGGLLPGRKVTPKIAVTRHTPPGIDLISPSNNHDIYSIEDLAQIVEELKTANPRARVSVKVPVVPGIGIIAMGIAKARADIINLSGYDGGTGAARKHALRHAGLPVEIGVAETHRALIQAGLRSKVEIWCDGGMKTAADVIKMLCLGTNRVGFGTLAMIAVGCTVCRLCHTGTCYRGIATQIESVEEARQYGVTHFTPLDYDQAVERLCNLFGAIGEEVRRLTARLGFRRTQDLVGRTDLLVQVAGHDRVDLSFLLAPAPAQTVVPGTNGMVYDRPLRRPRNHLTTLISQLVMEMVENGEPVVSFEDEHVTAADRALGTHLAGELVRYRWRHNGRRKDLKGANLHFYGSSIPGNGLGAFSAEPVSILVEGGAQDGMAKSARGSKVVVLKGLNYQGQWLDGSVGKGFAYGAQEGLFIVQGNADSRACIRLSGADVIIGGQITEPVRDELGFIGTRANIKGFACEYMTAGRVLILGDPGPWMCAGMTGGVVYLRLQPQLGFDEAAIRRRLAKSARVELCPVTEEDWVSIQGLLHAYGQELTLSNQQKAAEYVQGLIEAGPADFVKLVPLRQQADQNVVTE